MSERTYRPKKLNENQNRGKPPKPVRFGLFGRIVIALLLITSVPITLFGLLTFLSITSVGDQIVEQVFSTVDDKTRETMELQAVLTAKSVSKFLERRVADLNDLRDVVPNDFNFLQFSDQHKGQVWQRGGTNESPRDESISYPLYKEIAFIDTAGNEITKISNNRIARPHELGNVRNPHDTRYLTESYFSEAIKLEHGEVYISHLNGFYVTREDQIGDAVSIEKAVEGKKYDGVIRLATPAYDSDKLAGIVVLALDHRHLMELTQHILPNSKEETVFPVYASGDYAFMFDDRGWIITHPKYWDLPGVDSTGNWMPAFSASAARAGFSSNHLPFNLDSAGHVHENYPIVAEEVRQGRSGSVITTNVGGVIKVMAYSPIYFNHGDYSKHGIFGGITIGAEIQSFRGHAAVIAAEVSHAVTLLRDNILLAILLTLILTIIVSWLLSRNFAGPIVEITKASQRLAEGTSLDYEPLQRSDEIGELSHTFKSMATELDANRHQLLSSMAQLERSKSEVESYARDLEYQLNVFRSIQRISNILGSSVQLDLVLQTILRRCVEGLGFDRAILYLIDDNGKYLTNREMFGFSSEEEKLARRSQYNLNRFDCIETRVVHSGEIAFVEDFESYREATELDRKIRAVSRSKSFAFVPLKVKEKIIGILGADKMRSGEKVRLLDVNSLQVLANQAARVIENTRLYNEVIQQRNFVENVIQSMLSGVITIDSRGAITSINRAAENILEIDAADVVQRELLDVLSSYSGLATPISDAILTASPLSLHNLEVSIGGETKFLTVHVSGLDNPGSSSGDAGAIIIVADRTERKRLDDHVHRVERLASLGRFAAGIAHEIRNPVTGINIFLDDLYDKLSHDSDLAPVIERSLAEVERLDALVNEILEYAAPPRGELKLRDLNDLVSATLHFIDKECRKNQIQVESRLHEGLPPLLIDGEKIRQALLNITLNATQIMSGGGKLTLVTRFAEAKDDVPEAGSGEDFVVVEISDTGPGIQPDLRDQIFEPFFSKRPGGTGLGLSITQSIVAEHGGRIQVSDNLPHGTKFTIYLRVSASSKLPGVEITREGIR